MIDKCNDGLPQRIMDTHMMDFARTVMELLTGIVGFPWAQVMVQIGYAFVLDSLLQFCPTESAVLETSLSNHTHASSSMF